MINVKVQIEILYLHEAGLRGFSLCLIQNLQFVTCYIDALKNLGKPWDSAKTSKE